MNIRRIAITGAAALALVASGTAAGATLAGPVGGDGTIHGCYDSGGNVKVIDASATCPKTYTSLNWSQTGPQGATGPQGDTGAQGPAGPSTAGSAGLDVVSRTALNVLGGNSVDVHCLPSHPFIVGGGYKITAPALTDLVGQVVDNEPITITDFNGWQVQTAGTDVPANTLEVFALCAK